jgi:serine/threonine-protein kinase HipA
MRVGVVSIDGAPVGTIREVPGGVRFQYDEGWVARAGAPVSLTLPVRSAPYDTPGLGPFFENLLPEGWLLELATSKLKISKDDAFGLLLATCADCVGDVEIRAALGDGEPHP